MVCLLIQLSLICKLYRSSVRIRGYFDYLRQVDEDDYTECGQRKDFVLLGTEKKDYILVSEDDDEEVLFGHEKIVRNNY